jgi:hypothetical protein
LTAINSVPLIEYTLEGEKQMLKRLLIVTTLGLLVTLTAVASDREDDVNRTHKAAQVAAAGGPGGPCKTRAVIVSPNNLFTLRMRFRTDRE